MEVNYILAEEPTCTGNIPRALRRYRRQDEQWPHAHPRIYEKLKMPTLEKKKGEEGPQDS